LLKETGHVKMADIKIGDMVNVGNNTFSRVYGFGHRSESIETTYLQLFISNTKPLEISEDHMLFVKNKGAIPASAVRIGDNVVLGDASGAVAVVNKISTIKRTGAYAPFTEAGTIVVSNVLASNYVSLVTNSAFLQVGGINIVPMHWLAHASQTLYRMACRAGLCKSESYTSEGISKWVYRPYLASKWLVKQHAAVLVVFTVPVVMTGVIFNIIEFMLTFEFLAFLVLVYTLLHHVKGKTMMNF
jgi:Hint module